MDPYISQGGNESRGLSGVSPEAFGAGIGRGIAAIGDALDRKKKLHETTQAALAIEDVLAQSDEVTRQAREEADRYGVGHSETVAKDFEGRSAKFLATIKNPQLRAQYEVRLKQYRRDRNSREEAWAAERQDNSFFEDAQSFLNVTANGAKNGNAEDWGGYVERYDAWVEATPLPATVKEKLRTEGHRRIDRSYLEGVTARSPETALELLKSGGFDHLDPQVIDTLTNEAGVSIRAEAARVAGEARQAKSEARESVNLFQQQVSAGMVFEPKAFEDMLALAKVNGLEGEVFALSTASVGNDYNRISASWTPSQWDGEAARLRAAVGADPAKANPRDVIALQWVEEHKAKRINEAQTDPLAWGERNGGTAVQVDYGNPATIQARIATAKASAQQLGSRTVSYLRPNEVEEMRADYAGGRASKSEVVAKIGAWGKEARAVARQIAPDDAALIHMVGLPNPYTRNLILQGQEVLKGNATLAPLAKGQAAFRRFVPNGPGGPLVPASSHAGVIETARAMAASIARDAGLSEPNDSAWAAAFHLAVGGGAKGIGGVAWWMGKPIMLPANLPHKQFTDGLTQLNSNWPKGRAPVWSDGRKLSAQEVRQHFTPVFGNDAGDMTFVNAAGQELRDEGGKTFKINAYRLRP